MNPAHDINLISNYNHNLLSVHYIFLNLFRILRPLRLKYKLSINELIVLNGMYCYTRHESTNFSENNIYLYIGYYSRPKIRYYITSLTDKGYIVVSDIMKGVNRFNLTLAGLDIVNQFSEKYLIAINKFYADHNITI